MPATFSLPLLERARVAAPCPAKWDDMTGDEKIRHCALCNLNVHNFSAMSDDEAERILAAHFNPDGSPIASAGRVCAGFFRRADGTYLLQDCPTGLAALKAKVRWAWLRLAAAIGLIGSAAMAVEQRERRREELAQRIPYPGQLHIPDSQAVALKDDEPFRSAWQLLRPTQPQPNTQLFLMGRVSLSPAPTAPSTPTTGNNP